MQKRIKYIESVLSELYTLFGIKNKEENIAKLQVKMSDSSFWNNQKDAGKVVEELKDLKEDVDVWGSLKGKADDISGLLGIYDSSYEEELTREVAELERKIESFRIKVFLSGKLDSSNAIVEINSGAGGTESCDWAQMIFRMYMRWADNKGFKVKTINEVKGDEAGFKNITFFVEGRYAYGYLKAESGVHRLVRISPFDSNKRRHTSFASVAVYPQIKDNYSFQIRPDDLRIETFRAGGHGGQHVNVTDSAVRITHIPTGLVVSCQNERSQYQNKQAALGVLKAKLYELNEQQRKKKLDNIAGQKRKIEWGSQIRSYVLFPYLLVKDHRTNVEKHDAHAVLDGDIDDFIEGFLKSKIKINNKNKQG